MKAPFGLVATLPRAIVLLATAASFSTAAFAADVAPQPAAAAAPAIAAPADAGSPVQGDAKANFKIPEVIQGLQVSGAGMQVLSSFQAAGGLAGWVVKDANSGKDVVVYTTPDEQVLIAGLVLDKTGKNLSSEYADQYLPKADYAAALADFHDKSASFDIGKADAKASITIVYDPNCPYCHAVHKLVTPAVQSGELRVRFVPVAILGRDSPEKAAGLLGAQDKTAAIQASTFGLGVVQKSTDPKLLNDVNANTELMRKHGFNGTPVVLYQYEEGGETTVVASNGVPDIRSMFSRLGISGALDSIEDADLKRFLQ